MTYDVCQILTQSILIEMFRTFGCLEKLDCWRSANGYKDHASQEKPQIFHTRLKAHTIRHINTTMAHKGTHKHKHHSSQFNHVRITLVSNLYALVLLNKRTSDMCIKSFYSAIRTSWYFQLCNDLQTKITCFKLSQVGKRLQKIQQPMSSDFKTRWACCFSKLSNHY